MKHTQGKVEIKETVEASEQICQIGTTDKRYFDVLAKVYPAERCDNQVTNAERITDLWNAAEGMSNDEAVKALKNYEKIKEVLDMASQANTLNAAVHFVNEAIALRAKINEDE